MKGFLQYIPGNSILHQLSPITKLALSVLLCACAFLSSSILYISFLLLLVLGLSAMSGIGRSALQIFSLLLKLSLILFLAQIFFIREGDVLVRLPLNLFITDEGLAFAILIALRLMLSALPLALIITVTPMSDLAGAMVQKLRIPYKYAFALTTAIRFIPIFSTEISEIIEAQRHEG